MSLQSLFDVWSGIKFLAGVITIIFLFPYQNGLPVWLFSAGLSLHSFIIATIIGFLFLTMHLSYGLLHLNSFIHQRTLIFSISRMIFFLQERCFCGGVILFFDLLNALISVGWSESVIEGEVVGIDGKRVSFLGQMGNAHVYY